jgi:hypothetical protein
MRETLRKHLTTIVVAFVTATVASGGTALAIVANAHKVDRYHANQLIRLSRSAINNDAIVGDGTLQTARQVSIKAPKKGFLFIVASSDVFSYTVDDSPICSIYLDGTQLSSSARQIFIENTANPEEDCSTDIAWPVAAGTHLVQFRAAPATSVTFDETTLEVLFVPFNGNGFVPNPVAPSGPTGAASAGNN